MSIKVGNGRQVFVCKDPWLSDNTNPYISTPLIDELADCAVHFFLNVKGSQWVIDLVRNYSMHKTYS